MGLIKAFTGSVGGNLADQWKEYFYCDSMSSDVLICKGHKKTSSRSSNTKGSENVISDGSVIAVSDGQCMLIVDGGKVVELCAEPGEFRYSSDTSPSIFTGSLGKGILNTFRDIGKRFTFGGDTGRDQRIYYVNTKEIVGNKYGTATPVPFRVVDRNIGLDIDIAIRCNGEYSYKITDPILFYTNVTGNVSENYSRSSIDSQLKSELLTALQPAFAKISDMGIRYSSLPGHTSEIADALNDVLSQKWVNSRGISIASFGVNSVAASEEDEQLIKDLQRKSVFRDASMGAAAMVDAQSEAMKAAASNSGGAMLGFMGMGVAQNVGGNNAQNLYAVAAQQQAAQQQAAQQQAARQSAPDANSWKCPKCQTQNSGKFCLECGEKKPSGSQSWTCSCGKINSGKFCPECGAKRPSGFFKCNKCGWTPEDPSNPPKFCPECGDKFDSDDLV